MAVGPYKLAANDNRPGFSWVKINLAGANVDLTDPEGPTKGYCARQLYVEGGGVVKFDGVPLPDGPSVEGLNPTVPDNFYVQSHVSKVYNAAAGTTAAGVWVIL